MKTNQFLIFYLNIFALIYCFEVELNVYQKNGSIMNYTIMKDNKVVEKGIIKEEGTLYKTTIDKNEDSVYKIILTMSKDDIIALGGISTYAEFTFI